LKQGLEESCYFSWSDLIVFCVRSLSTNYFLFKTHGGMAVAMLFAVLLLTRPQESQLMRLSSIRNTGALRHLFKSGALVLFCFLPTPAQKEDLTPPKAEVRLTVGASGFTSADGRIPHGVAGASLRFYVTRRVSVEPEFLYMRHSPDDQDYLSQVSVAYDLTDPAKPVVPYLIAGIGALYHRGRFFGRDFETGEPRVFDTSFTAPAGSAGAGVKIFLTRRLFIAPEGRIGRQPSVRGTMSIGYVFSGRE
jgi:hypothetical protein